MERVKNAFRRGIRFFACPLRASFTPSSCQVSRHGVPTCRSRRAVPTFDLNWARHAKFKDRSGHAECRASFLRRVPGSRGLLFSHFFGRPDHYSKGKKEFAQQTCRASSRAQFRRAQFRRYPRAACLALLLGLREAHGG